MAVALALLSALAYGLSDFVGGLVSRRTSAWAVAVVGSLAATACTSAIALVVPGDPQPADFAWAALAGLGSGAGAGFLYRGFAAGRMGVVAPVSAVGAATLPVLVGLIGGERPALLAWLGIGFALPAIWLVAREPADTDGFGHPAPSRTRSSTEASAGLADGLVDGILAGLGFGLLFSALGQVPDSAGVWPLALTQLVSVPAVVALATVVGGAWVPRDSAAWWAVACGVLGTVATGAFLLATQQGYLAVAGVLSSLYPASTVLLAAVLLHERVHRAQGVGLGLCALAVVLVALG